MKQFRRLIGYMMPYKGLAVTALLMVVLGVAFDLLSPWFLKQAIDQGIAKRSIPIIVLYTLLLAGGQILKSFAMYTQGYTPMPPSRTSNGRPNKRTFTISSSLCRRAMIR